MGNNDDAMSLTVDAITAKRLVVLAETWGVSVQEAVRRTFEQLSETSSPNDREFVQRSSEELIIHEAFAQALHHLERGTESEHQRLSDYLMETARNIYRCRRAREKSGRLEAFKELQRNLHLTPAEAQQWQETVIESRR
jgi:hypothetical protein